MSNSSSDSPVPWHRLEDQRHKGHIRKWSQPTERKRWEPKIIFITQTDPSSYHELQRGAQEKPTRREYSIPLRLATAASPVIERDVDGLDLDERTIVAMLNNQNQNAMHLFLQYICRYHRHHVTKYAISETYPKMLLWCEVYQLAREFEILGLQKLMVKRITWRLFEFEDSGEICKEYMDIIELVKDEEDGCWEWLRCIIVDVKWMIARERTERGITLQDELPDCMEGWGGPPLLYSSDFSGDSVDLEM